MFKIYRSSAGSGKTYRLAVDYLKLALQYPQYYKKILAVTFTNKATYEMKDRIMKNLNDLASGQANPDLIRLLSEETGWDELLLREKSSQTLKSILHGYSYFSVSTIDSFFQRVISSFSREMGIHGGGTIEFDLGGVTDEIIDRLFTEIEHDPQLLDWLLRFTESRIEDNKGWDVRYEVQNLAGELYFDRFHAYFDTYAKQFLDKEMLISLLKKLKEEVSRFRKRIMAFGREGLSYLDRAGLLVGDLYQGNRGPGGLLVKMANGDDFNLNAFVLKAYQDQDNWFSKSTNQADSIRSVLHDGLYDLYRNAIDYYHANFRKQETFRQVLKLFYNLGLYANLLNNLKDYRQENNAILISDLSHLLRVIIGENDAPYIYEKVGNYYHHFLMDEFQDTSDYQWHNFQPLVKNSIAMGQYNMLVGDVKQSIYRWRGGDWQLLHNRVAHEVGESYIKTELLQINWRSREKIISFNNRLFQQMPEQIGNFFIESLPSDLPVEMAGRIQSFRARFEDVYADVAQDLPDQKKGKKGGKISFQFLSNDKKNLSTPPWNEKVFPEVVDRIKKILDAGYSLKDIAILVRTKDEGKKVADYLLGYHHLHPESIYRYDVVSSESLFLESSAAVNASISFMRLILDENNVLARINLHYWMAVLKHSPEVEEPNRIFRKAIEILAAGQQDSYFKGKDSGQHFQSLPIMDLLEWIIRELRLENFPFERAYITGLQNVIMDYLDHHNGDLHSFIAWWEQDGKKQSIKPAEGQNAIQILTIHQSKGLQFEMVIVPFCSWNLDHQPNAEIMWCRAREEPLQEFPYYPIRYGTALLNTEFSDQYLNERSMAFLDNLNLLYVALTRAITGLFVFAAKPIRDSKIRSIGDVVYQVLPKMQENGELSLESMTGTDVWGEEYEIFSAGELPGSEMPEEGIEKFSSRIYDKGSWHEKISIRRHPDLFSSEEGAYQMDERIHYGILLHDLLSRIIRKEQAADVIANAIRSGVLKPEQKDKVHEMLKKLWKNSQVDDWFSGNWNVKTEVPVLPLSGQVSRMDRVMIQGSQAVVVDYKTGRFRPEHKIQVQEYRQILQKMGYNTAKGFLLYLGTGDLIQV